jgi:hypothetical protein
VAPPEKARIGDKLPVGVGELALQRSRDDYGSVTDASGRVTPYKPATQIQSGGDFDFGTEKRQHFQVGLQPVRPGTDVMI